MHSLCYMLRYGGIFIHIVYNVYTVVINTASNKIKSLEMHWSAVLSLHLHYAIRLLWTLSETSKGVAFTESA